jgi:hypothetical protein
MPTLMPTDANNHAIPALRFKSGGSHQIAIGATSTRNATAFTGDTKVISLYATVPVYLAFGGATVTATTSGHYFPAGIYYDIAISAEDDAAYSHIAVLRADTDGTLYVSEKE